MQYKVDNYSKNKWCVLFIGPPVFEIVVFTQFKQLSAIFAKLADYGGYRIVKLDSFIKRSKFSY